MRAIRVQWPPGADVAKYAPLLGRLLARATRALPSIERVREELRGFLRVLCDEYETAPLEIAAVLDDGREIRV